MHLKFTSICSQMMDTTEDTMSSPDRKGVKRRRDADQRILDQFWVICDPNQHKRNKSLKLIVDILMRQHDTNGTNDVMYCLERVIRGMASARQFARHGFCVLLTQLLVIFEERIPLEMVFELSERHLQKIQDVSNHDSVIGWSLVMASLIKSGRLNAGTADEIWDKTFEVLYSLGMSKQYIELVVCDLFTQFMPLMDTKVLFDKIVWTRLKTDLKTDNRFKPFFIFVCLFISDRFPKYCDKKGEINFILKSETLHKLSLIIKESTAYQPLVHPMNRQIVKHFLNNKTDFSKFWSKCVDDMLFTPNQIEKGFLGFELIKIVLPLITSTDDVSTVLSPSFLRLFIQSLSAKTHPLHSAAQQLCEFFTQFTKNLDNSELQLEIVNNFTKQPGSLLFDIISKSKFFGNLCKTLNSKSIDEWTRKLKSIFLSTNKVDSNDLFRIRCIQQISDVCKSIVSVDDIEILWSNIKFLFIYSYFDVNDDNESNEIKKPAVPISESLRNILRNSFRSTFNHITHLGSKTTKEKLITEVQIMSSMLEFINDLFVNQNMTTCLTDSRFLDPFQRIAKEVSKLNKRLKKHSDRENEIRIFILLYSMVAIQLFEEYEEIDDILKDVSECMRRAVDGESEGAADDAPLWADVLIDLILSLLTKNSKLTKNMLLSSFKHICGHITNAGVQYLVDAINPSNDNKLFGGIEDSDVDDEEMDAEEESDKSESESESEDEEPTGEVDENFRNDVINALGAAAENDDDEESVYLSDSEMFQFDDTLAAVFKSKYSDKKEANEKQNSILMFRIRCLELLQIYLNSKSVNMDQILQLIQPIVSVAKSPFQPSKQNQLGSKAIQLMVQITKIKDKTDDSLEVKDLKEVLEFLVTILNKSNHLELQKALNSLFIWTEIGFKLWDIFVEYSFIDEIRAFKKSLAIQVLLTLCRTQTSKNKAIDLSDNQLTEVRQKCLTVVCSELSNEKLKSQYVSELLQLYDLCDKLLKDRNVEQKISRTDEQELTTKLKSLSKQKRRNLNCKQIVKKLVSS
ncbi:unnamed protein product [Oppiella nova]|uniref:DNA polymerase V n=1 Tax=Oppiella nova TaxID=334625 RepID=A0A7R9QAA0_9ACAR|nr:unnamed protein product [Oppiella nova]CAG2161742.1 unnamed protein product [Oppiella nova]